MGKRVKLAGARVYRGGVTARQVTVETYDVDVVNPQPGKGIYSIFKLSSKGGGTTHVESVYNSEDYKTHLRAMVENDRTAALQAMSEIMHEEMVSLPEREDKLARAAQQELVTHANNLRAKSPYGPDYASANMVYEGVKAIAAAVEKEKEKTKPKGVRVAA